MPSMASTRSGGRISKVSDDDSIFEPYDPDNHGSFKEKGGGLG